MTVDEYFDQLASPVREVAEQLRSLVVETDSRMTEQIKWNVPVYSIRKNICSIIAHKKHVNLQIFQGGNIKDAKDLDGAGKDMRHIKFHSIENVKNIDVQKYLKQAIKLD